LVESALAKSASVESASVESASVTIPQHRQGGAGQDAAAGQETQAE
jgi:hypothetical protein